MLSCGSNYSNSAQDDHNTWMKEISNRREDPCVLLVGTYSTDQVERSYLKELKISCLCIWGTLGQALNTDLKISNN